MMIRRRCATCSQMRSVSTEPESPFVCALCREYRLTSEDRVRDGYQFTLAGYLRRSHYWGSTRHAE